MFQLLPQMFDRIQIRVQKVTSEQSNVRFWAFRGVLAVGSGPLSSWRTHDLQLRPIFLMLNSTECLDSLEVELYTSQIQHTLGQLAVVYILNWAYSKSLSLADKCSIIIFIYLPCLLMGKYLLWRTRQAHKCNLSKMNGYRLLMCVHVVIMLSSTCVTLWVSSLAYSVSSLLASALVSNTCPCHCFRSFIKS